MKGKHLNAKGKGESSYDYKNDILLFKIKDREYKLSLDFGNLVVDVDKEGFITGLRIFDASQLLRLSKLALKNVKQFEFNAKVEEKVITIQLRFMSMLRNKCLVKQGQDFVRDAINSKIEDSEVSCTVA
ncbi:MAG: DUF2283 domain-containing protein [Candidatus Woesearchaeota archaeon]|nr:DUF2283 domain-containing protein [Candidatus Woesearchaeota archaeon]